MTLNIKILTTKAIIISALLFSFSPAFAQYKLELEWGTQPGGKSFDIASITKSDNDSLIYVSGTNTFDGTCASYIIGSIDGSTFTKINSDFAYNLKMSKDGKTLAAAGGHGVGLLDPKTFEKVYWESSPKSEFTSMCFNEFLNKIVICGDSFIEIYDVLAKKKVETFNSTFLKEKDRKIQNANLSDDGKYIVYSTWNRTQEGSNWVTRYYLKMIDLQGNLVKDFGETTVTTFQFTVDGKTLVYFKQDGIHFFDLLNFQDLIGSQETPLPSYVEMSSDGKFMLAGGLNFDFETKKSCEFYQIGTDPNFRLNSSNSSLFLSSSRYLYKFNIVPTTSIHSDENKLEFQIHVLDNDVFLSSKVSLPPNIQLKVATYDGKVNKIISHNEMDLSGNNVKINIADLTSGIYYIEVSDEKEVIFTSKFIKVD